MATEIEMKLRVPDEMTLAQVLHDPSIVQYMYDDYETQNMLSIYYDTEDGVLSDRRWTLRYRVEGEKTVLSLKTASLYNSAGIFTRNEWQCEADSVEDAIPLLMEFGAPQELTQILKGRPLVEICRAEFTRTSGYLYMPDGVRIEISGDVGTLSRGDVSEPIIELELELLFGDASALPPLCSDLEQDYGLQREQLSKFERANNLNRPEPPPEL